MNHSKSGPFENRTRIDHSNLDTSRFQIPNELESSNLPSVVLCVEQEVGADDGDANSDDGQDHEDQEHEAVHVVDLVSPERGEDEVPVDHKIRGFVYKKSLFKE